jgi:hypothetical protein
MAVPHWEFHTVIAVFLSLVSVKKLFKLCSLIFFIVFIADP